MRGVPNQENRPICWPENLVDGRVTVFTATVYLDSRCLRRQATLGGTSTAKQSLKLRYLATRRVSEEQHRSSLTLFEVSLLWPLVTRNVSEGEICGE